MFTYSSSVVSQVTSWLPAFFDQKSRLPSKWRVTDEPYLLHPRSNTLVLLQGLLRYSLNELLIRVLVDSLADDNFIDSEPCSQANIPTETLDKPEDVLALDGRLHSLVMHQTSPVSL